MSALQALAQSIAARGTPRVFGIPGSGPSLTLIDALDKAGIPFITTHFEGSAAVMAGVTGYLSGQAGAAVCIKGPGLANMAPGLAFCSLEGFPMVALAEAYTPDTPSGKAHKRLDHGGLVAAVSKGHRFLSKSGPDYGALADWAEADKAGAVLLNIAAEAIDRDDPLPSMVEADTGIGEILSRLGQSQRPVLIAGTLAIRQKWTEHLNGLSIPIFTTAAAKGAVDETLAHAAGVYTGAGLDRVCEKTVLPQADLIIGLGLRSSEVLVSGNLPCAAVNIDPLGNAETPGFEFDSVAGTQEIGALFDALKDASWGLGDIAATHQALRTRLLEQAFLPAQVFETLAARFDGQARLTVDTGYFCTIAEHAWQARTPGDFLGAGQSRYMGAGLPMAIAAALHDPNKPVIAALGDGGIGMYAAEAKLAVRHKLPLLIVLLSDGGFGSVRTRAINNGLTQQPLLIPHPSWLQAFDGLGIPGASVKSEPEFEKALADWNPASGPCYIEAAFDPDAYQDMVSGVRA
ncbi:MAG: thiamine pyrophosphate-binding protein [Rhodospirillales bacterium]|nr:thiamine pyrophosphate-binding protein [Rhodospirillales bacterium]